MATAAAAGELTSEVRRVNPVFLLLCSRVLLLRSVRARGDGMKGLQAPL